MAKITASAQGAIWTLVDSTTGEYPSIGDEVVSFRGEEFILDGGAAPRTENSTGRVYVKPINHPNLSSEFFPSVFGLKWVQEESEMFPSAEGASLPSEPSASEEDFGEEEGLFVERKCRCCGRRFSQDQNEGDFADCLCNTCHNQRVQAGD